MGPSTNVAITESYERGATASFRRRRHTAPVDDDGGESACWLDRVCDHCGALVDADEPHHCRAPAGRGVLYLIRHGHTAHNALAEVHGLLDDPLDEVGVVEAEALGRVFTGVPLQAVYASPLRRAVQTAGPVARAAGLGVTEVRDVLDRDYGRWTGHARRDVIAEFGSLDAAPGVEPWDSFTERVVTGFDVLATRHRGQRIAVVAHDAVNQALLLALFPGRWPDHTAITQRNGCWNRLEPADPSGWTLGVFDAIPGDDALP